MILNLELRWTIIVLSKFKRIFVILSMQWQEHIISDSNILLGKPTVKGTRISIEHIIGLLAQG